MNIIRAMAAVALLTALGLPLPGGAATSPLVDAQVNAFLEAREALLAGGKVDVPALSRAIGPATADARRLVKEGNPAAALKRMQELEVYMPLADLPSFNVHEALALAHLALGDKEAARPHQLRAVAMRELLLNRVGGGSSLDDARRAVMVNDIVEATRLAGRRSNVDMKGIPHQGREILEVTYEAKDAKRVEYFEIDPRMEKRASARTRLYDPVPVSELRPEHVAALETARRKRRLFLEDPKLPYAALVHKIDESSRSAFALFAQGKAEEALARLKEIEAIRPLEDIPMTDLLSLYSAISGKLGNTRKQMELRTMIFGVNQAIAHSGDGLAPETAVEVIAVSEEYVWLRDRGAKRVRQQLVERGGRKYDVLTAVDAAGNERDYYFDVSRVFDRNLRSLTQPAAGR